MALLVALAGTPEKPYIQLPNIPAGAGVLRCPAFAFAFALRTTNVELIIIAAVAGMAGMTGLTCMPANRGVIGLHNTIPWRIPEDMAHFKATTMGHPLIMGRKTYLSLGAPLPGRRNIVVSANPRFRPHPDCLSALSLPAAVGLCANADKAFVIGGEQLYRAALPLADTLILTLIDREYEGDAFFPDFADLPFRLVDSRPLGAAVPARVNTYRREAPAPRSGDFQIG